MISSMTGFASGSGECLPFSWSWELRSVNAKGLDMRLRVPDWLDGLEVALRGELSKALARGNVTLSLRLTRAEESATLSLNTEMMSGVLDALSQLENEALDRGLTLAPSKASDLLGLRGMLEASAGLEDPAPLVAALRTGFPALLADFVAMREAEGAKLAEVLQGQVNEMERLAKAAAESAETRKDVMAETLQSNLARVLDAAAEADPDRIAQELALIAVKSDVTEEIDRLGAHVAAAREHLAKGGTVGRKLDFLMQEFNREANTLCSKAQSRDLTAIGLEMKAVIDQMREQVQNIE